ncbi:hypothetical protein SHIRM173S_09843 [Streptomyces hirsutus]
MPLARFGCEMVLFSKLLWALGAFSDLMASESSPWLRRKLLRTRTPLAVPLRLRPSAVVSRMRLFSTTRLSLLPVSQRPTFRCWSHMPETEEFGPREPLTKLSGWESTRSVTSPMTAKSLMWTLPAELDWSMKREERTTECQ